MVGGAGGGVSTSVCSVGGGNKIVATLRADCKVYPTTEGTTISQLANLMNYKIRTTECDQRTLISGNLNENVITVTTPAIDAGKQLLQCARDKDLKGVKNALARAAPFTSDWLGMSALHFAAMNNQYEMCEVLLNGGINKDSKTKVDRTPLHLACFYGNEKVARILLSRGCLVNSRDMLKMTPLHWAVEKGHKSIVRLLLKHDADVTAVSKFGRTPIALAVLTEQADLLEELEAARQQQINIKFNKEHEKETSEAVNSIMCLNKRNSIDGATMEEAIRKLVTDDGLIDQNDYTSETMVDLDNIKEVGILGDSAVKLLKSHGISMMPDDEQESKKLLTTALQNGRQLVLSEGGKLLLNEAKKLQRNQNNNKNSSNDNNNNHNGDNSNMNNNSNSNSNSNNNNNNNNSIKIKVPVSHSNKSNAATAIKGNLAVVTNCNATDSFKTITIAENKCNANIIKSKDHMLVSSKGKNIRIISLNDFKKLYGNTNVKTLQSLPTSLTANRLVKIRPISKQPLQQKQQMNSNQANDNNTNANQNQNKVSSNNSNAIVATSPADNNNVIKEEDSLSISDIIAMQNVEVEKELELENSTSPPPLKIIQPSPGIQRLQQQQQQQQQQIHLLPGRRLISASQIRHVTGNSNNNSSNKNTSLTNNNHSTYKPYNNNHKQNSCAAVVPLLTLSEVSRQLMELRKQCEEFRRHKDELRKLDLAQKELRKQNEELRKQNEEYRRKLLQKEKDDTNRRVATERDLLQRLERLEELLLVERTDEDATKS